MLSKQSKNEIVTAYTMLLPNLVIMAIFIFWPMIYAFYVSLHEWNGLSKMTFNGFDNYVHLVKDSEFWQSLWITAKYALFFVPAIFIIALLLAVLVKSLHGFTQKVFRTSFFLPYAISLVIGSLVWSFMYDPMHGYINGILHAIGIGNQKFLVSITQAIYSVAVVGIWQVVGFNMIIFLASLNDIPISYYEAAEIDGASSVRKFFSITFPLLKNTNVFIILSTMIGSFQVFDQIKVMTGGGPANSTMVTVYYIYQHAFQINQLGFATSAAFALFVIIMGLTLVQLKITADKDS
ncbi:hypothetical protein A8709_32725 [Paenibacillus pectinilyticus]|uniref:ABC transmembrane type-1 domain-containing protein n=2 Tax=Paenibacillus pectinilyticus TaxID=512399 RepID=A0A1C0ZXG9_9BACL|nr:hypothetical protein A8709_32725 [Paenibacillus pectinilyticus]